MSRAVSGGSALSARRNRRDGELRKDERPLYPGQTTERSLLFSVTAFGGAPNLRQRLCYSRAAFATTR